MVYLPLWDARINFHFLLGRAWLLVVANAMMNSITPINSAAACQLQRSDLTEKSPCVTFTLDLSGKAEWLIILTTAASHLCVS